MSEEDKLKMLRREVADASPEELQYLKSCLDLLRSTDHEEAKEILTAVLKHWNRPK